MAFATKYIANFTSLLGNAYEVKILMDGYSGSIKKIIIIPTLNYVLNDWFDSIVKKNLELQIYVPIQENITADPSLASWSDLLPLLNVKEQQYKVEIKRDNIYVFNGYVNSEVNIIPYKQTGVDTIQISASNFVNKLNNVHPAIIDTAGIENTINILNSCLVMTGRDCSIFTLTTLEPTESPRVLYNDLYNLTALNKELFWKNNVERDSAFDIISEIISSLDSYIYEWNNKWYIERYNDLIRGDKPWPLDAKLWHIYEPYTTYNHRDEIDYTYIEEPSIYIIPLDKPYNDMWLANSDQSLQFSPQLQSITYDLDEVKFTNLSKNDFTNIEETANYPLNNPSSPTNYYAGIIDRKWMCFAQDDSTNYYYFPGNSTWDWLTGNIGYSHINTGGTYPGMQYKDITNAIYRKGTPIKYTNGVQDGYDKKQMWIGTRFNAKISGSNSSISISYKLNYPKLRDNNGEYLPQGWDIRSHFLLFTDEGTFITTGEDGGTWKRGITHSHIDIPGYSFNSLNTAEVKVSIPVGDIDAINQMTPGNHWFIFYICYEQRKLGGETEFRDEDLEPYAMIYGDVVIQSNETNIDNKFTYYITEDTNETADFKLKACDLDNDSFANGYITYLNLDDSTNKKTTGWVDGYDASIFTLAQWKAGTKLGLLGHENGCKIISTSIQSKNLLKPFEQWQDPFDPSSYYVLTNIEHNLLDDIYGCKFFEWRREKIEI